MWYRFRIPLAFFVVLCLAAPLCSARWLVRLPDAPARLRLQTAAPGMKLVHRYRHINWALYEGDAAAEGHFRANCRALNIEAVQTKTLRLARQPNDPHFSEQLAFQPTDPAADIELTATWDVQTSATGVVVAVIDSGIDAGHEDLKDNLWTNPAEVQGQTGVDDDGNGYVDDLYGWNFVGQNNDLTDNVSHGAVMAGVIGARGDNGLGIAGVCWQVPLMTLKAFDSESANMDNVLKAIEYAIDCPAVRVINASWSMPTFDQPLMDAIAAAGRRGIVVVTAAGNDGDTSSTEPQGADLSQIPYYPASYALDNIISVAAVDSTGSLARFSNYGPDVTLAAPGVDIFSTLPGGGYGAQIFNGTPNSGTSFAAPIVSGAVALLLAREPGLTPDQVRQRLIATSRQNGRLTSAQTRGGLLDVRALLQLPVVSGIRTQDWMRYH